MQVSNFVIFGVAEAFLLLLAVSVFLLIHNRKLKNLLRRLQKQIQELADELRAAKNALVQAELQNTPDIYKVQVNDQLQMTRRHHESLNADRDIALDLSLDTPIPRRITAFRHAFLIAEKEALHASQDATPDWQVLESKLHQLIQFYTAASAAGNESADQLQQELEVSKELFFAIETKWKEARDRVPDYREPTDNEDSFESLLRLYDEIGGIINPEAGDTIAVEPTQTLSELTARDGGAELRQGAEDQHQIIDALKQKLAGTGTSEERDNVIQELHEQLDRQTRFIREAETCTQLLEQELTMSNNRIKELEDELADANRETAHNPEKMIQQPGD